MTEIKRYRCKKECAFALCDEDGREIEGKYMRIRVGSIWCEGKYMIAGGPDCVHLDEQTLRKWCEPTKEMLEECFEPIESLRIGSR